MRAPNDLMLILDRDTESLKVTRAVADLMGCERVEVDSPAALKEVLAGRDPTIAVVAIDFVEADGLAVLQALAAHNKRPATFLVGSLNARVAASAKRAAEARGLSIVGASARPLDPIQLERVLTEHLKTPAPIPRPDLERALGESELALQYQPKIALDAAGHRIQGVEALVRWQHPRRGLLEPRHFLQAVEDAGLLSGLTDFVMTEAVRQAGQWRAAGLHLEMVINLSTALVRDRAFPERLACLLRENEVPADQIVLDVTEAPHADKDLMLDVFTRLRILGVGISLDNFGTGLSSLTELYRMPYSEIKVDRSLMADVPRDREAQLIVRAIADLAHSLELPVCAEGVESRDMLNFAVAAKFDSAQGRLFCGPVNAAAIEKFVNEWPRSAPSGTGTWSALRIATNTGASVGERLRRPQLQPEKVS